MANVFRNTRVWALDTAAQIAPRGVEIRVKGLRWVGASNAGDSCIIKDTNGCIVWESVANGANFIESDAPSFTINGFVLDTISTGRLYVEVQ